MYGGGDLPAASPIPPGSCGCIAEAGALRPRRVMVGDSAIDVRTGRAAGAFTVGVSYGFDAGEPRETPPDVLLDDLRALPGVVERLARV